MELGVSRGLQKIWGKSRIISLDVGVVSRDFGGLSAISENGLLDLFKICRVRYINEELIFYSHVGFDD